MKGIMIPRSMSVAPRYRKKVPACHDDSVMVWLTEFNSSGQALVLNLLQLQKAPISIALVVLCAYASHQRYTNH